MFDLFVLLLMCDLSVYVCVCWVNVCVFLIVCLSVLKICLI